jgi:hypothetical protein
MRLFHYGTLLQTPCIIQQLRKPTAGFSRKVYLSIARMQIRHTCSFCFAALFHLKAPAIGALMAWSVDYVMIELNHKRAAIRTLSDGVTELRSRYITSLRREEIGRRLDPPTHWQSWSKTVRHISKNLSRFFLSHYLSPEMFPREERKLDRDSHRLISWRSNDRHVGYSTLQGWLVSFCRQVVWTLTDGCARMCPHWINPIEILKEKDKFELFWLSTYSVCLFSCSEDIFLCGLQFWFYPLIEKTMRRKFKVAWNKLHSTLHRYRYFYETCFYWCPSQIRKNQTSLVSLVETRNVRSAVIF